MENIEEKFTSEVVNLNNLAEMHYNSVDHYEIIYPHIRFGSIRKIFWSENLKQNELLLLFLLLFIHINIDIVMIIMKWSNNI